MKKFRDTLVEVWREACRGIDIDRSSAAILSLLRREMPADCLMIRLFGEEGRSLDTVSVSAEGGVDPYHERRTELSVEDARTLRTWCARGEVIRKGRAGNSLATLAAPFLRDADLLVGPLGQNGRATGLLILGSEPGRLFSSRHAAMAEILLEPLSVALENDLRVKELAVLREAAEAEKTRLLTRLGRDSIEDDVVGATDGLRDVMEKVRLVAASDILVLFLGETGTGKELMAREIHRRSPRAEGPVLRVNCGAIPPDIIDSQLFGHEKGSFTGAAGTHRGWFERADGGTLFLDEIGELPMAAQVRLLRVLQDGWLERVGGQKPIRVDVRVIAATNKDLPAMVRAGTFREDLWYRISTFPIHLPPLRERKEDIPQLARHLAGKAARRFCLPVVLPDEDQTRVLSEYPWPGNVREMSSVLERAAILGNGSHLEIRQALGIVAPGFRQDQGQRVPVEKASDAAPPSLDEAMRRHIESALRSAMGRVEGPFGAARILEINPQTLRARMKKLGIDWRRFRENAKQ